jgi:DNA polymerase III alpha subunit
MDFSIEGKNIRYGLNSIKGISEKALKSLIEFRSESGDTKYEMFISAKQAGLNIGTLCALIQAGALSHFEGSRPLLVLEAQVFNILTDREKRNFIQLGEKYDYKLLDAIVAARDKNLVGDDGRPLFKESRFQTFKKKYEPYKNIYMQNSKSSSFANWYFENQLLGYSYSEDLRNIFGKPGLKLTNLKEYQEKKRNANLSVIGIVNDCFTRVSRSGNKYMKLEISDEFGSLHCMLCNNSKESKLDEFLSTNQAPEKNSIIVTYGSKADDIFFVNNINVLNENIYMKLADLK